MYARSIRNNIFRFKMTCFSVNTIQEQNKSFERIVREKRPNFFLEQSLRLTKVSHKTTKGFNDTARRASDNPRNNSWKLGTASSQECARGNSGSKVCRQHCTPSDWQNDRKFVGSHGPLENWSIHRACTGGYRGWKEGVWIEIACNPENYCALVLSHACLLVIHTDVTEHANRRIYFFPFSFFFSFFLSPPPRSRE